MANPIKIVTDSTADLTPEYVKENDISVVPLYVNFAHATYRDGVDLSSREFYPMLEKHRDNLPKTSTPSVSDFFSTYENILQKGFDILSLHISSGLSSTLSMAESAAKTLDGKIHVFDTKTLTLGLGLQVHEALEMIKKNMSLEEIAANLTVLRQRTEVFFALDTLEYLQKGGRIGKVSALLGSILNIKPVVRVENGVYVPLDKVRNQKQAVQKMVEHMKRIVGENIPRYLGVAHGSAEDAGLMLKELVEQTFEMKVLFFKETGPVLGVHTGPGAVGLAFTY